ncbi:4-alpha-glucanotransferase [Chondrinema litorale]|uniref:4-alpha-glucanotransferase n=1 Tax=Chondrinema litorale TaxID=2994555 RepID=UPI0025437F68|nr:4-alpha-glucanotransferase [Chondrinema litorale]UZR94144.1 4-alpha-glucanotransferase [Chondrinema litorale]
MKLLFKIHFHTQWGQKLKICGSLPELGEWKDEEALNLNYVADGYWELELDVALGKAKSFDYKYFLYFEESGWIEWEAGKNRTVEIPSAKFNLIELQDAWRSSKDLENVFETNAFSKAVFTKPVFSIKAKKPKFKKGLALQQFKIKVPRINPGYSVCIIGNNDSLGNWDEEKAVVMGYDVDSQTWSAYVNLDTVFPVRYKYGFYDNHNKKIVEWEAGEDRYISTVSRIDQTVFTAKTDEKFRYNQAWKGSGVAVPVFSLRSKNSLGVGEFSDIKLLIDWAEKTGMKMVQILPVNDTVATHTWTDSYPYSAISVFALHPIYMNLEELGSIHAEVTKDILLEQKQILNKKNHVDYEQVMRTKSRYFKLAYDEHKENFLKDPLFKVFFEENKEWLVPYAAFSYLRDLYGTPDFSQWEKYSKITPELLESLTSPEAAQYDDIAIHYFIQFHLNVQLKSVAEYARSKGIVLKGDIPIGIYRYSVDAWMYPDLFHMECQAGAPPDAFALEGQNWGFPTYNWQVMAQNGFKWWTSRLKHMAKFFDAYRIDHILGFFRIWEVPWKSVEGILGHFNPALPLSVEELQQRGVHFDYDRLCKPYVREHMLQELFGDEADNVKNEYLDEFAPYCYHFKPQFDSQRKVEEHLSLDIDVSLEDRSSILQLKKKLFKLLGEVILLDAPFAEGRAFNFRNAMHFTQSYRELDWHNQKVLDELYIDYFYKRHEQFWRDQAMIKLPGIKEATNMLVCGEDLGMVPDCVPGVMDELSILSLAIQRMPNNSKLEFGHPAHNPYLSVCSTSTHDMSTIRGWWEEDHHRSQRFYNMILGKEGEAPFFCEPWLAREIIAQHLYGSSMWAVFPIQDLLAIDGDIRRYNPADEQINVPSNPKHYWKYRMHINLEDLLNQEGFNGSLHEIVANSGRLLPY